MLKIDSKTPIKIYTIPTCSDCRFAKRYFNEHQIPLHRFQLRRRCELCEGSAGADRQADRTDHCHSRQGIRWFL